jgi:hypothetical protein
MARLRLVVFSIAWLPASAFAADFPYSAKVVGPRAEVFSGPGRQNYVTDQLQSGETVEVYRHDPGGWCAIRPPKESFSWVEARFLAQAPGQDNGIMRTTADDVPCYIGSRVGPERSACRVRLRRDELVEMLAEESVGGKRWYKIAPPAGEFRWIETAQIQGSGVGGRGSERKDEGSGVGGRGSERSFSDLRPEPIDDPRELRANTSKYTPAGHRSGPVAAEDSIADALRGLEVKLSLLMTEDASQWRLDELTGRAESLLDRAGGAAERESVRAFLAKLSRLDAIKNRRHAVRSVRDDPRPPLLAPALPEKHQVALEGNEDRETKYDGVGRLREVVSRSVTAAPFALVDDAERVRA